MDSIWQDTRYSVRAWRKAPGFTLVVVLTTELGIAANTTVFSVINTLFLNPLPFDRPSALVVVRTVDRSAQSNDALPLAHANLTDVRERNHVFEHLAGESAPMTLTLLDGDRPQRSSNDCCLE